MRRSVPGCTSRALALGLLLTVTIQPGGFPARAQAPWTADESARLADKIGRIVDHGARGVTTSHTVVLPEREINAYLHFEGASLFPDGIRNPRLTLGEAGEIEARAVVDLDAVSRSQNRGLLDPLAYLSGELEVIARGSLVTAEGRGRVEVESVSVGGIPVPRLVLDELVRYYSRNETHPNGVELDAPFALPHRIDRVTIEIGEAVVEQ